MERETSKLLIKSNRVLGTRLVEAGLTTLEEMDTANEAFITLARKKDLKRASLLRILIFDNQTLKEESLLDYQIEQHHVGAIHLENYILDDILLLQQPFEIMRASWTIPIDFVNDRWFLATAYFLSDVVREFWEDRLQGRITWLVSPLSQFESTFEALEAKFNEQMQGDSDSTSQDLSAGESTAAKGL